MFTKAKWKSLISGSISYLHWCMALENIPPPASRPVKHDSTRGSLPYDDAFWLFFASCSRGSSAMSEWGYTVRQAGPRGAASAGAGGAVVGSALHTLEPVGLSFRQCWQTGLSCRPHRRKWNLAIVSNRPDNLFWRQIFSCHFWLPMDALVL